MANQSYHDLCKEIDILEIRIKHLEGEYKVLYAKCFKDPKRRNHIPLDIALNRMKEICDLVEMYVRLLDEKNRTRKEIEQHMSEFDGIEYKVAYYRDVRNMTLPEVAAQLGYSYDWVKKLSARTSRLRDGA